MSNIFIENLTFGYDEHLIFKEAMINIDDSWHLGLVGRNGRGKTTLLQILQGKVDKDLKLKTVKNFVYFPQTVSDPTALTADVLQGLADFESWKLERELTLLQVDLDVLWRPFESLSGGEITKCLLALLFLDTVNFPLLDEPTNHLDQSSRKIVASYLQKKSGFIVVSHDRDFLDAVTDHTLAIERQQISLYQGNFSIYEVEKKRRDSFELTENEKLKKDISRLKDSARDKSDWSKSRESDIHGNPHVKNSGGTGHDGTITARAARLMKKSKTIEKRMTTEISDKEKLLKNLEKIDSLSMIFEPHHQKEIIRAENFSLAYEQGLFEAVNFSLKAGQIIALTGANGCGKSSMVKYLEGNFEGQASGKLEVASSVRLSYVRQLFSHQGSLKNFSQTQGLDYEIFLSNLRKLGMERKVFEQSIETMSQGQQKKIEVAKSLSQPAQLYIWDEPLNYLDVFNQDQIIELLKAVRPTMLVIEHDSHFIAEIAAQVVELKQKASK